MKVLVLCASVLWCLVTSQDSSHYHVHSLQNTRTLQNEPKLDVFLQNPRDTPLHLAQFSQHTGGVQHTHGIHQAPLHTDQASHVIHFPQHATHASAEETNKDTGSMYKEFSFDRSQFRERANSQTERHTTQGLQNASQPNGLANFGDQNTFQIHSIVQPKVTRTVYINGVKVENNSEENVASIISALLNPHLQNQHTSKSENEGQHNTRNVNPFVNYNQQNNAQVPAYILSHLNNYKQDSEYTNGKSNNYNQIPSIDIRMGPDFGHGKLAKLREKGRYMQNATNIYNKPRVNQHNMQARAPAQGHRTAEDRVIFV